MAAEGKEDSRLIEYAPHSRRDVVDHVLPSASARILFCIYVILHCVG